MTVERYEVLLASDNSRFRNAFRKEMSSLNLLLETADSPRKLTMFYKKRVSPDVAILDVDSINKNLYLFIFYLKKMKSDVPIVVVSRSSDFATLDKINKNLNVLFCMPRPNSKRRISDLLNNVLDFLTEDLKKKLTNIDYLKEEKVFACAFADKSIYFIKRSDIPGDEPEHQVKSWEISSDRYYFLIHYDNGQVIDVAWDFVRQKDQDMSVSAATKKKDCSQLTAEEIGKRIVQARENKNMTQTQLASQTGILRNNISRIENGYHQPSLPILERIADGLGIPVVDLLVK